MEIDKVIVIFSGTLIIMFIYSYFLRHKEAAIQVMGNTIHILVNGGYKPQTIVVKKGQKTTLQFERTDPSSCLEEVVLPDFGKRVYLPLNKTTEIEIQPDTVGEYEISCGMNMFHGKIRVEEQ